MENIGVDVAKKDMSAARRGAALKREKKLAASVARAAGLARAAAERLAEDEDDDYTTAARYRAVSEETALIDRQISAARRALGLDVDEPNPIAICLMIESLTAQMRIRLSEKGFW
jgi:hypothetical protein